MWSLHSCLNIESISILWEDCDSAVAVAILGDLLYHVVFLGHSVGVPLELCPSSKANKVGLKIFTLRENQGKS